ncbi:MAG TPA: SGNH/GDSL hydrolase family protein [Polyangia bacterium]|nr:SGNH/GDSL hydrolase family protein [Polyangia bacterium]
MHLDRAARPPLPLVALIAAATAVIVVPPRRAAAETPDVRAAAEQRRDEWRRSRTSMYLNDFGELDRYRRANAQLKPAAPGDKRVVFYGDSITDQWRLENYFPGKPYINRGINAQTTAQLLVRFRADVIALAPQAVVILAGTNDIAGNTGPMTLEDIEGNYASMAELARLHGIKVILASILPVHNYTPRSAMAFPLRPPDKIAELNRWLRAYCAGNGHVYLDYFSATADARGWLKKELSDDGLHPGAAGYALMASLAQAAIDGALGAAPAPSR